MIICLSAQYLLHPFQQNLGLYLKLHSPISGKINFKSYSNVVSNLSKVANSEPLQVTLSQMDLGRKSGNMIGNVTLWGSKNSFLTSKINI